MFILILIGWLIGAKKDSQKIRKLYNNYL